MPNFRVFNFALYLKPKAWKPRKVFIYFKFYRFYYIKHGKGLKPFTEFQINIPHVLMSEDTSHKNISYYDKVIF